MKKNLIYILIFVLINSCSTRNLIYFSDLPEDALITQRMENSTEPSIQPIDLLNITVSTLNPESNMLFNSGVLPSMGGASAIGNVSTLINQGYRVDKEGFINFPILGKVKLAGLTLEEATEKMTEMLESEAKNPIVNIKVLNFRVTVIGEVNSPSTLQVLTEKINVMEAIGLAGDLTPYGKRENVLIIREIENVRTMVRLDLNKKDIFTSPYYYLQQNDIVYVEPARARAVQASMGRNNISFALSILSLLSIYLTWFL